MRSFWPPEATLNTKQRWSASAGRQEPVFSFTSASILPKNTAVFFVSIYTSKGFDEEVNGDEFRENNSNGHRAASSGA